LVTIDLRLDALRSAISGDVVGPADGAYDEARSTFNATIDRRPAAIARPRSTEEVAAAVRWAREAGLLIAVRGGGHSVAGHATADQALVIDLRLIREVVVDPARRQAMVGGGALWMEVDRATMDHGLAMPGGTFGDTGVGGLALGGGIGFLMGTGGLTCDTLVRAEMVTADGSVVIAGSGGDPELLWALRGGGGNFGIVTRFEFALQPVGPLYAGQLAFPIESAGLVMKTLAELAQDAPDQLAIFAGGPAQLEAADAAEPGGQSPIVFGATLVYQGTPEAGEAVLRPLRAVPIVVDRLATMNYLEVQKLAGELPFGLRHYWKGHLLRALDDGSIDSIVAAMGQASGDSFVLMEAITGAARREPADGAAFGQREARWNVSGIGVWEDPAEDERQIAWVRDLVDALQPGSLTGAGYANYAPVDETPHRVQVAFGAERFARLAAVKRRYDPDNVFRFNLNIPPG
jgi:FAD/FMN-containing dehydrogenase